MSIRLRLTLWYTGILAVTLLLFGITLYYFVSVKINSDARETLRDQADYVNSQIIWINYPGMGISQIQFPNLNDFKSSGIFLQSYIFLNERWSRSSNLKQPLPFTRSAFDQVKQAKSAFETYRAGEEVLLIYYTPMVSQKQIVGVLQVATEISGIYFFQKSLKFVLALLTLITLLIAATAGWYMARKTLKPIGNVIVAANQIQRGTDLDRRIEYHGPKDEIGKLTDTINGMLSRVESVYRELDDAYHMQRQFVSDASHELRTPLTTIRGNVELLRKMWGQGEPQSSESPLEQKRVENTQEALLDISDESERMSRLVNDLLSLARADAGYSIERGRIEMLPLVEEVARRAQFLPKHAEWQVGTLDALEQVWVMGNKDYLQQLLFIFIENAFKYTPAGTVRLDALRAADQVGIAVSDTGIGMDKNEIPNIFNRFYRADQSRGKTSGTGLGLSIAKWIIDEHHGSIEVHSRAGEGSRFTIWLPISFAPLAE